MSTGATKNSIRLSVLDRLIDNEPDVSTEVIPDDSQLLRVIQGAIRRDLENLLNTR